MQCKPSSGLLWSCVLSGRGSRPVCAQFRSTSIQPERWPKSSTPRWKEATATPLDPSLCIFYIFILLTQNNKTVFKVNPYKINSPVRIFVSRLWAMRCEEEKKNVREFIGWSLCMFFFIHIHNFDFFLRWSIANAKSVLNSRRSKRGSTGSFQRNNDNNEKVSTFENGSRYFEWRAYRVDSAENKTQGTMNIAYE